MNEILVLLLKYWYKVMFQGKKALSLPGATQIVKVV
jgi:hypothetical protein